MKCDELLAALNAYIDGEIDPQVCAELSRHLEGCNPCRVVIDTLRKTITLYKGEVPYELPPEVHARLHECLKKKWQEQFGQSVS
ncbi:MAG TPA: zf-HC2 domain-containing protein [Thermogutta sp.]|nr:zf-HC2 domain-containing protein [Thermogutta sp.]HPZ82452.1 zf-HC2 domain-containing protein [Thermogutta sp.]HQF13046.1 zf-HC2 domain-containing protein [Thermogutta sp.]